MTDDPIKLEKRLGSVGKENFGTEVRIVDSENKDIAPGETGELIYRGDQVMKGYWRMPEKTAEVLKDGWLYSGDIPTLVEFIDNMPLTPVGKVSKSVLRKMYQNK